METADAGGALMASKPEAAVLKVDGVNCDGETAYAFEQAGASAEIIHVNELKSGERSLEDYQILALAGGFSYGDDIASGKVFAVELINEPNVNGQLQEFIHDREGLAIGICNGFQVMVRTGLLPEANFVHARATLADNASGHFEARWVDLEHSPSRCVFLEDVPERLSLPVAHGEGRLVATDETWQELSENKQIVFSYLEGGEATEEYPANPNGSRAGVTGITDETGRVLGMMPHPERFVKPYHHPHFSRGAVAEADGNKVFEGMVSYVRNR